MPAGVTRTTRFLAWLTVVVQVGIIGTGGLVRVTGSGLGCPTWPKCNDSSLVATPEMGIHGIIEFGNRTLTGVLCIVALLTFLAVWRTRGSGLRLVAPAVWIGVLIIVQAVIGGMSVWASLDPRIVGVHFVFSAMIVAISAVLLARVRWALAAGSADSGARDGAEAVVSAERNDSSAERAVPSAAAARGDTDPSVPAMFRVNTWSVGIFAWITVLVGVLTTGSGPHAGDSLAARNGLDPELMQHLHSYPAYLLAVLTFIQLWAAGRERLKSVERTTALFVVVVVLQIAVGIVQSRTGLPGGFVVMHMLLAGTAIAVVTTLITQVERAARSGKR